MARLEGKVAIITGVSSSRGMGFATARVFAQEGASLIVTDLNGEGAAARAEELKRSGAKVYSLAHDVRSETGWEQVIEAAVSSFGKLDVLVNNAGAAVVGPIEKATVAQLELMMAVNVTSVFLGCQRAIAQFRLQGRGGAIVNVCSAAGTIGALNGAIYGASKGAVRILTKCIALEVASENIRVNAVHPGIIRTDMLLGALEHNPNIVSDMKLPLGAMGEPEDVAAMILFLASDEAKYITGGEYLVDGGLTTG